MNISSAIVIPHPEHIQAVQSLLAEMPGIEVAAVSAEGKIIITLESDTDRETIEMYESVSLMEGVLSASMVYHQQENEPEAEISVAA